MNAGELLRKVLPWIGAAATGGVPALIGMAAKEVAGAIGGAVEAKPEAIAQAVANATPEQILALKSAEQGFQERMQAMGFQHVEELARIGLEETKAYVADTADARHVHAADRRVFWLGIAILVIFLADVGATFWLAYEMLTEGIKISDVGIVAAVFGVLGTLNGYVAANAQQVVSYFFGSSRGSKDKDNSMADAVKALGAGGERS